MKKIVLLTMLILMVIPIGRAQKSNSTSKTPEIVVFTVNMDCQNCVEKITKQLTFEKGVRDLYVNLENQVVAVKFRPDKTNKAHLQKVLEKMEYEVSERQSKEGLPENWK